MNEATRQFYLSALGIDVWEARYPLPGAAPSVARGGVADVPPAAPSVEEENTAFEPATVQSLEQVKSVLDAEVEADQAKDDAETASLPVETHGDHADSTISLRAVFWIGRRVSLAADLGANAGSETQLRLGTAIMRAMGEPTVTPEIIHWPAFENRALPGNDDASFDRLLQGIAERAASTAWLVLGSECTEILSPGFQEQGHDVRLSTEVSLSGLVSDGNAKRELWEAIKQSGFVFTSPGNGDGA